MPRKMNAHHNAHVRTRLEAAQEALREHLAAEATDMLHDAHAETRRDAFLLLGTAVNHPVVSRDFTGEIRKTKFAKAHPHELFISNINAALNEYHDLCSAREQRTEQEKAAREEAQALIKKLRRTFEEIAKNGLARAAVLEAFCHPGKPAELDERIASLSRAIESLEGPRAARGRPETPELDWLISRIADLVVRAREQTIRDEEEEANPNVRATELAIMRRAKTTKRNDKRGRAYTEELLAAGRVFKAGSTLDNKLANLTHHQQIAAEQRVEINHLPASIIAPDS